jgi:hypothetical protein
MRIKQLQNISFITFILLVFITCKPPLKTTITTSKLLPDTLFAQLSLAHKYGKIPSQEPLIDSVTNLYISRAHEGSRFTSLDSSGTYYKAYSEGTYQLSETKQCKIIRFEPESNAYYSLQLYILNDKEEILDALELAYLFGEEGTNGEGDSYIIKEENNTKVFVKQYWVNYQGRDAEIVEQVDTIIAYEIKEGRKASISIDSKLEKKVRGLFVD